MVGAVVVAREREEVFLPRQRQLRGPRLLLPGRQRRLHGRPHLVRRLDQVRRVLVRGAPRGRLVDPWLECREVALARVLQGQQRRRLVLVRVVQVPTWRAAAVHRVAS